MQRWIMCMALFTALETASADDWRVSTSGFGTARIGMTLTKASQALHVISCCRRRDRFPGVLLLQA